MLNSVSQCLLSLTCATTFVNRKLRFVIPKPKMPFSDFDKIIFDYNEPRIQNYLKTNIDKLFKQIGPKCTRLELINVEDQIFPVKIVDAYLRKHSEKVMNVNYLSLMYDPCNSVQLLKMMASRFPKIERLDLNYSDKHPVEQALAQLARMPNLIELNFPFCIKEIYECLQASLFAPHTKMQILHCEKARLTDDNYDYFEATIPVLFPNLIKLDFTCPSKAFADRVEANAKRIFPRLQRCEALDVEDLLDENSKTSYLILIDRDSSQ